MYSYWNTFFFHSPVHVHPNSYKYSINENAYECKYFNNSNKLKKFVSHLHFVKRDPAFT